VASRAHGTAAFPLRGTTARTSAQCLTDVRPQRARRGAAEPRGRLDPRRSRGAARGVGRTGEMGYPDSPRSAVAGVAVPTRMRLRQRSRLEVGEMRYRVFASRPRARWDVRGTAKRCDHPCAAWEVAPRVRRPPSAARQWGTTGTERRCGESWELTWRVCQIHTRFHVGPAGLVGVFVPFQHHRRIDGIARRALLFIPTDFIPFTHSWARRTRVRHDRSRARAGNCRYQYGNGAGPSRELGGTVVGQPGYQAGEEGYRNGEYGVPVFPGRAA